MQDRGYRTIRVSSFENIAKITLSQPERKNPISALTVNELLWALEDVKNDVSLRVLVVTGDGDAFCAGGDLKQMGSDGDTVPHRGDFSDLLLAFTTLGLPTIAQVNGLARGGALGLIASCDFAVAAESATFGTPEIRRGLFPMMIMAVLARVVSHRQLMRMMLLGETFDARHAKAIELVSDVVSDDDLESTVITLARKLAKLSPTALRMGLNAFHRQRDMALEQATPMLHKELFALIATEDGQEGLRAFMEKREPVWKGR